MEKIEVLNKIKTKILIENKHEFDVTINMALTSLNDFEIKMTFENCSLENVEILNGLFNEPKALDIDCKYFKENNYKIEQIVVEKINILGDRTVIWDCLSDEPFDLEIK